MAVFNLTVDDAVVTGLNYMKDKYNEENETTLTVGEFLSQTLSEWSRHATTKMNKEVGVDLQEIYNRGTPAQRAEYRRQIDEFRRTNPRRPPLAGRR